MRCLDPRGSRRSSGAPAHGELGGGRHLAGTILTGGAGLDRREDAEEDPSFEGRVAMTVVSGRAAQGRAISQKEIERPRAWAPPARRSENDFALERGETFTDRWLRLRAAGLGDEVWDRRHARGARGSVETLQKLVYVACAMTRLVRARATPRADSSASMRDVGRVEGVRSRPSEHDRFTRLAHDRLAALANRRARGSSRSLAARAGPGRQRHAVRRARGANAARVTDGTPKRTAGVNRQRSSRVGNAARSGPNEGDSSLK